MTPATSSRIHKQIGLLLLALLLFAGVASEQDQHRTFSEHSHRAFFWLLLALAIGLAVWLLVGIVRAARSNEFRRDVDGLRARRRGKKWWHLLLLLVLLSPSLLAQSQPRTFRIPFHTVNGLILLKGEMNGRPATLLLDTGSNVSFVDMHSAGLIQFKAEKVRRVGMSGAHRSLNLGGRDVPDQRLCIADLSDVSKSVKARVDGFIGADVLQEFSAVRIDYKNHVVELELEK